MYHDLTIVHNIIIWGCIKTNLAIFGGMNIHVPVIWGSLGYQGFDSYPYVHHIFSLKRSTKEEPRAAKAWHVTHRRPGDRSFAIVLPILMTR